MSSEPPPATEADSYSDAWFATFLDSIHPQQTENELAFLARLLPLPRFARLVDLCCGSGRHALPLAERGYRVVGIDANAKALAAAREAAGGRVKYIQADMRELQEMPATDAVICLWQSFGYYDADTNAGIIQQVVGKLDPGGRFLLDIYNRDHFATLEGTRTLERAGETVTQTSRFTNNRWRVELRYGEGGLGDVFDWYLYTREEIETLGRTCGLDVVQSCANYDETLDPDPSRARMQILFEKPAP
jgi:SAM-dependent methyltransferase